MSTLYVGSSQTYQTIADAVAAAQAGDTIIVKGSEYTLTTEEVVINKSLTLQAEGDVTVNYIALGDDSNTYASPIDISVSGFTIKPTVACDSGRYRGIWQRSQGVKSVAIADCNIDLTDVAGENSGILMSYSDTCAMEEISITDCTITGNTVDGTTRNGIYIGDKASLSSMTITGNTVSGTFRDAIGADFSRLSGSTEYTVNISNNNISDSQRDGIQFGGVVSTGATIIANDNTISNVNNVQCGSGDGAIAFHSGSTTAGSVTISGNNISDAQVGVAFCNMASTATTVTNNTIAYTEKNTGDDNVTAAGITGYAAAETDNNTVMELASADNIIVDADITGNAGDVFEYNGKAYVIGTNAFTTIEAAVAAAADGATVLITAGEYSEVINYASKGNKNNVTITGETDAEGNSLVNWTGSLTLNRDGATWNDITLSNINFINTTGSGACVSLKECYRWTFENCSFDSTAHNGAYGWNPISFPSGANGNNGHTISNCSLTGGSISVRVGNDATKGYGLKVVGCTILNTNFNIQAGGTYDVIFENNDITIEYDDATLAARAEKDNAFIVTKSDVTTANIIITGGTLSMVGDQVPVTDKGWTAVGLYNNFAGTVDISGVTIKNETENSFVSNFSNTASSVTANVDASGNTFVDANDNVVTDADTIANEILNLKNGNVAVDYSNYSATSESAVAGNYNGQKVVVYTEGGVAYAFVDGVAVDASKLYVNDGFSGEFGALVEDGKVIGVNAFANLNDAVAAAAANAEIIVSGDVSGSAVFANGKNLVITGTADFAWKDGWLFVGRGATDAVDTTVTFKDAVIGMTEDYDWQVSTGFNVGQSEGAGSGKANGTLNIENSKITTTYLANRNVVNVKGDGIADGVYGYGADGEANLTVLNGFYVSRDNDDTLNAEMNLTDGAYVKVEWENAMGIGYDGGRGELNITDSKFEAAGDQVGTNPGCLTVLENGAINVANGVLVVDNTLTNEGTVNVTGSTFAAGSVANNGLFSVSGESQLVIDSATGNGIQVADGATLVDTNIGGGITSLGMVNVKDTDADGMGLAISGTAFFGGSTTTSGTFSGGFSGADVRINSSLLLWNGTYTINANVSTVNMYLSSYDAKTTVGAGYTVSSDVCTWIRDTVTLEDGSKLIAGSLWLDNADATLIVKDGAIVSVSKDNAQNLGIKNEGTITVNGGTLIDTELGLKNKGIINLNDGTIQAVTIDNTGTLTIDAASSLTATTLTNSGTITIDADGYTGGTVKVINLSQSSKLTDVILANNSGEYSIVYANDGDVILTKQNDSTIYVNSAWSGKQNGEIVGDGHIYGYNAFSSFADAAAKIKTDGSDTTIKILDDQNLDSSIVFDYGTGDVLFTADSAVTIKQNQNGLDFDFSKAVAANITVDENVTFEISDNAAGFYVYYGPNLTVKGTIKGGQNWGCLYLFNGTHTVSETGNVEVGRVQLASNTFTIAGSMDTKYLLVEGGTFNANNAIIDANVIYDNNNGQQRWGASEFNINNSKVTTSKLTLSYADSVMNVTGASTIDANLEGSGVMKVDSAVLDGNLNVAWRDTALDANNKVVAHTGNLLITGTNTLNGKIDNSVQVNQGGGEPIGISDNPADGGLFYAPYQNNNVSGKVLMGSADKAADVTLNGTIITGSNTSLLKGSMTVNSGAGIYGMEENEGAWMNQNVHGNYDFAIGDMNVYGSADNFDVTYDGTDPIAKVTLESGAEIARLGYIWVGSDQHDKGSGAYVLDVKDGASITDFANLTLRGDAIVNVDGTIESFSTKSFKSSSQANANNMFENATDGGISNNNGVINVSSTGSVKLNGMNIGRKPAYGVAELNVDGGTVEFGSYGMHVGYADRDGKVTLKNGAVLKSTDHNVELHYNNGYTAEILTDQTVAAGALNIGVAGKGSMDVSSSTVDVAKLNNNSELNVTGASDIAVDTLSGSGKINFTDASLDADTVINSGEKNGSNVGNAMTFRGNNTVSGSKIYTGWNKNLNVGDWNGADASASLNITDGAELVYGGAAYIGTAAEDKGAGANKVTVTGATFAGHGGDGSLYLRRDGELEVKDNALASFSYVNLKGAVNVSNADFKAINVNFSGSLNAEKANVTISGDITEGTGAITLSNGSVLSVDDIVFGTALNIDLATPIKFDHTQAQIIVADAGGTNNMFTQSLKAGQTSINLFTNLPLGSYTVTILAQEADYTKTEIYSGIPAEITTYGSLSMDFTSQLKFSGDLNVPQGSITIDAANYTAGTYKLLDYTGSDVANRGEAYYRALFSDTAWNDKYVVVNGDLYLTDQAASPVYLNSAYTSEDAVTDGRILNYNAFGIATGAFSSGAAEIIVESDINELLATDYYFVIGQDTKISSSVDGEARLVNFYNNGTSYDIVIDGDQSNSVRETLTIGKNVTLEVADRIIWAGYYGNDVDITVDGTLGGDQLWIGADTTVSATGKLVSAGEAFVLRRGATVTLNGNAAQGAAAADRTASLEASYTSLLAGEIIANNTLITSGKIGANNAGYSGEGSIHVKLDNTIWNSTGNLQLGSGVLFEVNNGSILNVTLHDGYQVSSIGTTSSLWVDGGTVNASTMNVSGEIDVYNGKLNIADGKALTINEGGKVFVRGASDVKAAVDGAGWLYIEDAELDSDTVITGETANVRVVSGSSTVSGSELNVNAFQVGVGKGEDDLLDTLTGSTITFKDNAKLSVGGDTYDGWVGSQYAKRNEITDARYVLNVENSMMNAGYLHISTDGILNVSGHTSDDNKYVDNGRKVDFYAGDFIINGVANFSGTDAVIRYLKVSVDNTGTAAPGTVNITDGANVLAMVPDGANNSKESFIIYNNGIVNVDNATFTVDDKTNIAAGGKLNAANGANVTLEGNATNNGTINVTGGTFIADTVKNMGTVAGFTVTDSIIKIDSLFNKNDDVNNKNFHVYGESTLEIGTSSGRITLNDVTLNKSSIGGPITVRTRGDLTINDDVVIGSVGDYAYFQRDDDNYAYQDEKSVLSIAAGKTLTVHGQACWYYGDITGEGQIITDHVFFWHNTVSADVTANVGLYFYDGSVIDGATITHVHSAGDQVAWVRGDATLQNGAKLILQQDTLYFSEAGAEFTVKASEVDGVAMSLLNTDNVFALENGATATFSGAVSNVGTINVNGSTFTANSVANSGTFNVAGTSELHIDTLTGTVDINDGATVKNSYIGGAVAVDGGEVAFDGANTVASIDAKNGATVNINAGDSLNVTGSRTKLYNETINITGEIADALTADKSALNASLKMKGMSLAGYAVENDTTVATLNVTNAYVDLSAGDLSSKPDANGSGVANTDAASGTYNLNFTNSILDVKKVSIENQSKAKFDIDIDGSVVNASSNFVMADKDSEMTLSNGSIVNINSSFKSDGTINILSGSKLIANNVIQPSENAGMYGTVNVDNAELELLSSGNVIGHAVVNEGNINLTNSAKAKVNFINNSGTVNVTGSTFTATGAVTNSGTVNVAGSTFTANSVDNTGAFDINGGTVAIGTLNNNGSGRTKIAGETFITVDVLGGGNSMWLMDDAVLLEGSGIFSGVTARAVGSKVTFGKADNGSDGTITVAEFDNRISYVWDDSVSDYVGSQAGQELVVNDTLVVSEDWLCIFGASDGDSTVVNGNGKIVANNTNAIFQKGKTELNVDVETGYHLRFTNTDITITGTVSATVPDSVVAGQLTALQNANVTVDGGTIDTAHNLLIGYNTYVDYVGVVDTYKSTLTLKNGGVVETDYNLYLNKASEIIANNGTLTVGGNAYTYAESVIELTDSTANVTGSVTNNGVIKLTNSSFTVDGALTFSALSFGGSVEPELFMDWKSLIVADSVAFSNAPLFTPIFNVSIDMTGAVNTAYKLIDTNNNFADAAFMFDNLSAGWNSQIINGDLYLTKIDDSVLYVNSAYTSEDAALTDGRILGYNAFENLGDALKNADGKTVMVETADRTLEGVTAWDDMSTAYTGDFTLDAANNPTDVTLYQNNLFVGDITFNENVNIVLTSGAKLAFGDRSNVDAANAHTYTVNGTIITDGGNTAYVYVRNHRETVNLNGKIDIAYFGNSQVYNKGTMTVTGTGKGYGADNYQLNSDYMLISGVNDNGVRLGGVLNLVDTAVKVGTLQLSNGDDELYSDITATNSTLDIGAFRYGNGNIKLTGSTLNYTNTPVQASENHGLSANGTLALVNSTMNVTNGAFKNAGKVTLTGNAALNGDIELNGTAARLNFGTETVKYTGGTFSSDITLSNGSFATGHPESGQLQIVNGDVTMTGNITGDANSTLSIGGSILNNDSTAAATLTLKGNTVTVGTFWVGAADKVMEAASKKDGRFELIVDGAVLNAIQGGGGNASPRNTGSITVKNAGKVTTNNSQNAIRGNVLVTGEGSQFNSRNTNIYSEDNAAAATMEYTDKATGTFTQGLTVGKADNATRTGLLKVNNSASVEISTGDLTVNASGAVSITDNAALTVTAGSVTNKGKITVEGATFTANSVDNSGEFYVTGTSTLNAKLASGNIVVDTATLKGNIENNGFIYFVNDNTLAAEITGTGKIYIGQNGTANDLYTKVSVADDVAVSNGYFMVDDNALLAIASGKKFTFTGDSSNTDCYRFVFAGGNLDLDGELNIENSATRFSRANVNVADTAVVNAEQHICIYNSDVTINGEFNVTSVSGRGIGMIIGQYQDAFAGTSTVTVSGANAKLSIADCGTTAAMAIYYHANGSGALNVTGGATFETAGKVENSGTITVDGSTFTAGSVANNGDIYLTNAVFKANVTGAGNFIVSGNVAIDSAYSVENGSLTVNQDSALTVAGSAEFATVENNGTITVDWTASFGFANIVNNGTFTVDLTGYKGDAEGKVVLDHATGWTAEQYKALLGSSWDDAYFSVNADGDLVLNGGVVTTVYINSNYSENGTNDGHTWGVDAFNNHADALAKNPQNIIVYDGTFTASCGHNGNTAVIESGSFRNVYAGGADGSVLSDSTNLTIKSGSFSNVYGGSNTNKPMSINPVSSTELNIENGTFNGIVIGGDYVKDGVVVRESSNLTISGGTFNSFVAGGVMLNTVASSIITSGRVGDINFTISGGSFSARVYGGNFANKVVMSNDTVVTGDINLVIDATQNNIAFGEHIIAGSYGYGKVEGDVTVTFSKAADKTISFAADSIVLGGSGNAYTMVESDGTRTPNSFVYGERTVAFDSYSGDFGAAIKMFSDIDVTGNSNVNFTSSFSFADISDWDIEFGSSLSGIASNDFTGDTIDLDLTGFDGNDWTVMVGTENALSSFDSATLTLSGTGADQWIASGYGLKLEDTDDGSAKRLVFGQLA